MTERERRSLTAVALLSVTADGLRGWTAGAGRWALAAPLLAFPLCLLAVKGQERLRADNLLGGTEKPCGNRVGRWVRWHYLLWGLLLLAERCAAHGQRLTVLTDGAEQWLCLGLSLGVCLWLGRGEGAVPTRGGRAVYLLATVALGAVTLTVLPRVELGRLLPRELGEAAGLPATVARMVSLSGYAVYTACLPIYNKDKKSDGAVRRTVMLCGVLVLFCVLSVGTAGAVLTAETPLLLLLGKAAAPLAAVLVLCDWMTMAMLAYGCGVLLRSLIGWRWGRTAALIVVFLAAGWPGERETVRALLSRWATWGGVLGGFVLPALLLWRKRTQDVGEKSDGKSEI